MWLLQARSGLGVRPRLKPCRKVSNTSFQYLPSASGSSSRCDNTDDNNTEGRHQQADCTTKSGQQLWAAHAWEQSQTVVACRKHMTTD